MDPAQRLACGIRRGGIGQRWVGILSLEPDQCVADLGPLAYDDGIHGSVRRPTG